MKESDKRVDRMGASHSNALSALHQWHRPRGDEIIS